MPHKIIQDKDSFQERFNVSHETMERLEAYRINLEKWAQKINLVSKTTLADFWVRHAFDSAQLLEVSQAKSWIDFGSGAGFPGLIIAALLNDKEKDYKIRLVDTNYKRCVFLKESARILGVKIDVQNVKIEDLEIADFEVVTARAFASLLNLFEYSYPYTKRGAKMVFLKGEDIKSEISEAEHRWDFSYQLYPSISDKRGFIIEIDKLELKIEK